jgi:hypothetical protein
MNAPALAITDPHTHSAIANEVAGLVTASLMCGAHVITTMAATGSKL